MDGFLRDINDIKSTATIILIIITFSAGPWRSMCRTFIGRELEGGGGLGIYEIMFFRFFYVYNLWNSPVYRLILVATGLIWKLFKG